MPRRLLALLFVSTALVAACGDDDAASTPRYDDVTALADALDGVADGCALEYEGLADDQREVSICTLGDQIAELAVWTDLDALDALVTSADESGEALVSGPNWTVGVADADLAAEVSDATGGVVGG